MLIDINTTKYLKKMVEIEPLTFSISMLYLTFKILSSEQKHFIDFILGYLR